MLSKLQMKLEIPKRTRNCYLCAHHFQPGDAFTSVLFEDVKEGLVRSDYCQNCWDKALIEKIIASWNGVVSQRKEADLIPKDKGERALVYLQKALSDEKENQCLETNFLIALYLQRVKVLILRKEIVEETQDRYFLFEVAETEEMLIVPKVTIAPARIQQLQEEITKKLGHGKI